MVLGKSINIATAVWLIINMPEGEPIISAVIAVVFDDQQRVLIAQRPKDALLGGYWEFPGGKVEPGESHFQALQRELQEEVGIVVSAAQKLMDIEQSYDHGRVHLDVWHVSRYEGRAASCEQQALRWVDVAQLSSFKFPEVNYKIIDTIFSRALT